MTTALMLIGGITLLVGGAEALVRGASRLALAAGISPLVVGLTVVAYGTSMPELAVSWKASLLGQPDIAVANVVGSNICNILLILGLSATVAPLVVDQRLVRKDVPIMIGLSLLVFAAGWDGSIQRWEGALFFLGGILYTIYAIVESRRETRAVQQEYADEFPALLPSGWMTHAWSVLLLLAGLVILVVGARLLVTAAVDIALACGVSERVIGLTIVAAGTSLPELATSVVAAARGQRDIAVGNVVGSNLFNILIVMGASASLSKVGLVVSPALLKFDIPVMMAVALTCLPVFMAGHQIRRTEGVLLFGYFVAYTAYLVMADVKHGLLTNFSTAMITFVIPLTGIALAFSTVKAVRRGDHRKTT